MSLFDPPGHLVRELVGIALAEDLGEAIGCGAHVSALRRTATGGFRLAQAVTLDALAALTEVERDRLLLPADAIRFERFGHFLQNELEKMVQIEGGTQRDADFP